MDNAPTSGGIMPGEREQLLAQIAEADKRLAEADKRLAEAAASAEIHIRQIENERDMVRQELADVRVDAMPGVVQDRFATEERAVLRKEWAEMNKELAKLRGPQRTCVSALVGSKAWLADRMEDYFDELRTLRGAGQAEYAHAEENAFGNFDRLAAALQMPREKVLWTYLTKHLDGIVSWINGHKSQREPVTGRINDVHVYLMLLRGMIDQRAGTGGTGA